MPIRMYRPIAKSHFSAAFSFIELIAVMAIITILLAIAVPALSDSSANARQSSREIIKSHLQQARAHAIAKRTATALIIPIQSTGNGLGAHALSLIEVQRVDGQYLPLGEAHAALLQRWTRLPKNFHFVSSAVIGSAQPTVMDYEETLTFIHGDKETVCQMIVFAPNGQITYPPSGAPIHIAYAPVTRNGNSFRITQFTDRKPVFDVLLVNRLTGRTRNLSL